MRAVLILVGFTAVIAQIVLMRELIVVFYGNEITLGLMLCTWLAWTALGSSLMGRAGGGIRSRTLVAVLEGVIAIAFPASIIAVRASRAVLHALPGEILGPGPMLVTAFLTLGLFCTISGWLFAAGSRLYSDEKTGSAAQATSSAYLLEAAGSAVGGLLASAILIRYLGPFEIAALLALLNLAVAVMLTIAARPVRRAVLAALVAVFAGVVFPVAAGRLEDWSRALLWRGLHVAASRNSVYGNLVITKTEGSASLYENGLVLFDVPNPAAAEEAVHFALLEHPQPRSLLLIGGGVNGSLAQALQHPSLERLDYVELDPAILEMAAAWFPREWAAARADTRVHVHERDGRLFLKSARTTFDVIIVNLPDPETAQLNRFYTLEFFREARRALNPGGILSLRATASESYISPSSAEFLRCIYRTLREAFPEVIAIPGDTVHFCATARRGTLTTDPAVLLRRLRERGVRTDYVSEFYLPFRMSSDRVAQLESDIHPRTDTPVNRDFAPIAYYFDMALWSTRFHGIYRPLFQTLAQAPFGSVAGVTALLLLAAALLARRLPAKERRARASAGFCIAAMGLTQIGLEILLLLAFQAVYGYVYHQLAIVIAGFMGGLACGAWLGMRRTRTDGMRLLALLQGTAAVCPLLLYAVLAAVARLSQPAHLAVVGQALFPLLAVLCALPGGYQFPVASRIYFDQTARRGGGLGSLYGLDLAGSCIGAIALSVYLIPVYGFLKTSLLLAMAGLAPALLAASYHKPPLLVGRVP
ncbi:MAG: fused MFS/spermidine synthase [Bryobacteraceae bacterium]|nr:fused MFS/spermidine synthase [Bryobacteraceae bacterium]